jgi:hypothetical protein
MADSARTSLVILSAIFKAKADTSDGANVFQGRCTLTMVGFLVSYPYEENDCD